MKKSTKQMLRGYAEAHAEAEAILAEAKRLGNGHCLHMQAHVRHALAKCGGSDGKRRFLQFVAADREQCLFCR